MLYKGFLSFKPLKSIYMKWEESVITIPKTLSSTHVHELTHTSILGSGTQQTAVNPSKNSEFFFLSTSILLELHFS